MNLLARHEARYIGAKPSQEKPGKTLDVPETIATFGESEKHTIKREVKQKEVLGVSGNIERAHEFYIDVRTVKNKEECLVKKKHRYEHNIKI